MALTFLPGYGIVLTDQQAFAVGAAIQSADKFMRQYHNARMNPVAMNIAKQLTSSGRGKTERPLEDVSEYVQHEQIDTSTAAEIMGCTPRNIRYLIDRRIITGEYRAGRWWVSRSEVECRAQRQR